MSEESQYGRSIGRRTALRTLAGALALGGGFGSATATVAAEEEGEECVGSKGVNYAEIEFNNQRSDGTSVEVAELKIERDGLITIHTWDLIQEQDGAGTIVGVSGHLCPGEYENETVDLVAVPHRNLSGDEDFNFTDVGEEIESPNIPFTNGGQTRTDLPVDGAVNDIAAVAVVPEGTDGQSRERGGDQDRGEGRD